MSGTGLQVDSNSEDGCAGFSEIALNLSKFLFKVIFSRKKLSLCFGKAKPNLTFFVGRITFILCSI